MYKLTKPQKLIYDMEKFSGGAIAVICGSVLREGHQELSRLECAVNEIFRLNDALRTRIVETDAETMQTVVDFIEQNIEVLQFANKGELDAYANEYAKIPLDFHGNLCGIKIILLPDRYGIMAKLHHIIGDAWTLSLIASQFCNLVDGETPRAYAYEEYARGEADYLQSSRYVNDRAFFREQFKKCDEVTYLSEKQAGSLSASRKTFVIGVEESRQIYNYAETHHSSPFMLFMAALAAYMNRTKMNVEKFYIGTAVLNRTGVREKNTMGMFINTVPMLIELGNEWTFAENLSSIAKSAFSVFRHQKYNYDDVLTDIRKEFGFNERLYDVLLSYQNAKISRGGESESTWYHNGSQAESLQIHIDDRDGEGFFKLQYDYQTEKFTEHEIDMLHQHICNLLFDAIAYDGKKLYELDLLTDEERQKLLFDFNDTAADYPREKCIHTLFEEQVEKTPDNVALKFANNEFTFFQLNCLANGLAQTLKKSGVGHGDIVAIISKRSYHIVVAMLAILKCGAAYLPIDFNYPDDRINMILSDSACKAVLTYNVSYQANNTIEIPETIFPATENPIYNSTTDDICGIIYTSGSTGVPKGALLRHRGLVNYTFANDALYSGSKCVLGFATYTFDAFCLETILPMLRGVTSFMATEDQQFNQTDFESLVKQNPGCNLFITPARFKQFIDNRRDKNFYQAIHNICIGGEVFPKEFVGMFKETTNVFNVYGPTECSMWILECSVTNSDVTLGKPLANIKVHILGKCTELLPVGTVGELCVAGDCVGAGYLNRPELTAEKFIDNPFGAGKLYKTGDLSYWREDGSIVYVGRNDFQVKIRGLRIELGEIENAISSIDGILQTVVVVRKDVEGRQLICAFYTGTELPAREIRSAIGQKLPKYMLPHIFTHLKEMPLTSSGKINRNALPEVNLSNIDRGVEYVKPEGGLEIQLTAMMEEVLNYSPIGRDDDFFDLGGDSLKAIELISALEEIGYKTDVRTLFACGTIRELATKLIPAKRQELPADDFSGDIPATPAQMRVYTAQAIQGGTVYNVPYAFRAESVEPEKLQNAVQALVDRYEILRTHFEEKDGKVIQVIEPKVSIEVEHLESEDIAAFIRPFDLTKAPLLRVGYFDNTVIVDMHHIITDGSSMPVFFRELNDLYMGRELKGPMVQYRQFAVKPQDHADSEAYWLSVYSDELPVLELNTDFKRGQKRNYNGDVLYASLDPTLHQKILSASRKIEITPYAFYIGGFYILLSKFSGNEDIIVGTPMSGREGAFLKTLGMFVNTVALRSQPIGTKTIRNFLSEIMEKSVAGMGHQWYPYNELVKKLGLSATDRNPLFDVMFAYQDKAMTDVVFGDRPSELLPIPVTTAKYDFTFNVMPRKHDVVVMVEYCADLYRKSTIQRFIDGYSLVLEQMLISDSLLKDISAITEQERQKLLFNFNDTAVDYPRDKCVHTLFEEQAAKTPDETAVIACDRTLTYAELNKQANRIAHGLIDKGVGVGDVVAFELSRTSNLIAVTLGILKAGAAYLPVDPDYPQERIDFILSDSDAKLLITESNFYDLLINSSTENPSAAVSPGDLCYCIYTSGTTGMPKGVLITHKSVANFVQKNSANAFQTSLVENCRTVICCNSVAFDIVLQEIFLPLLNGLSVFLLTDAQMYNIHSAVELLGGEKYGLIITPTKLELYMQDEPFRNSIMKKISVIMSGAEIFPANLLNKLRKYTDAAVFNGYGPTETTCGVLYSEIKDNDITIGNPIANTQIYILDKYLHPTPVDVTGELCIAGDGVGVGYLNRPELTAEKFIDNPFGAGKLYKTGDLAYWREDGNIVYIGRNDFQVKIRGLRIELGEIENAISAVESISQVVVAVRKDATGRQLICAFYTGSEIPAKEIRDIIGQKLPKYMLPHIITHLYEIPLTPSGKINRKALPEVDLNAVDRSEEYVKPEGDLEKNLAALMEQVLEYAPIGRDDDFFDLGGDSLKAIEFVAEAHSEGIYFALQNIFDYPTVRRLAEHIENGDKLQISYADVDFTAINKILAKNTVEHMCVPQETPLGNILLAGATGFLGAHILADYLEHDIGIAYCLVRGKDTTDSEKRLSELLQFYFGDKYADCDRIKVICADLQIDFFGMPKLEYDKLLSRVDTVINAAASVKHYGSYKYFYEVNVETVKRLIDFCQSSGGKLIHISTLSVSGNSFADDFNGYVSETEKHFYESSLYIEQSLENVYARSKFEAEKAVLEAMDDGLKANIMRMGNLTNRLGDGQFQKNHESNAFLKRVKAVLELGVLPDYLMNNYVEFTPIDEAAHAVMMITRHFSAEQTVFHINSTKVVYMDKLLEYGNELGYSMKTVSGVEFTEVLRQTAKQDGREYIFETFINDMDSNDQLVYDSNIHIENDFTLSYLRQIGFDWKDIGLNYLRMYVNHFKKIGYLGV